MTLAAGVLFLAFAGVVLVLVLILERSRYRAHQQHLVAIAERLRPAAIDLVDADDDEAEAPVLTGTEARVFAELLAHYSRVLRGEAGDRIGAYFEASGAVDGLRRQLRSRRVRRRVQAAFELGDMASKRPVPELLRVLVDPSVDVRAAAARSLGRLGATAAVVPLIDASVVQRIPRSVTGAALLEIGAPAVPNLLAVLDHPDPRFRAYAVDLVGLMGSAADAESLPDRLRDPSSEVRASARLTASFYSGPGLEDEVLRLGRAAGDSPRSADSERDCQYSCRVALTAAWSRLCSDQAKFVDIVEGPVRKGGT